MIIKCKRIVTEDGIVDGYLEIEGKKIKRITQREIGPVDVDASQYRIIPGIFDTHNHGTMGYAMMSAVSDDEANVRGYLKGLASQGVTAVSYTHLDVYKRQTICAPVSSGQSVSHGGR